MDIKKEYYHRCCIDVNPHLYQSFCFSTTGQIPEVLEDLVSPLRRIFPAGIIDWIERDSMQLCLGSLSTSTP